MLLKWLHAPVISKNCFKCKSQQVLYFKKAETKQAEEVEDSLLHAWRRMGILCLQWLFCSVSCFLALLPRRAPAIKSFSHHTWNFCYFSYTDVPSWPCFELILPQMGRSRQKTTSGTVCKSHQFIKTRITSPLLFLNHSVPCGLGYQSLALHSLNIRPKETNCPVEEWEIIKFPFQPRYSIYSGLWLYSKYNIFSILLSDRGPWWSKPLKVGASLISRQCQSSDKFWAEGEKEAEGE